ncbi:LDL receptor domain-containing protein [Endozoicomonas sp. YOMI1]|uniref:LDL receptor domain-containing protein n=1 Tax=Endozoicomonas sp. YOMI1 TaxID=2828739 RepID=UPI0021473FF1|nr:LDL receptor domain-containing protein [Endozoicomonas sp. YOMI1]
MLTSASPSPSSCAQIVANSTERCHTTSFNDREVFATQHSLRIGADHRSVIKSLADYRVCSLAREALQAGAGLVGSAAGFALRQILDAPDIVRLWPGLKESLLLLSALPTMDARNHSCRVDYSPCDLNYTMTACFAEFQECTGVSFCFDGTDEKSCNQTRCEQLGRPFFCDKSTCVPAHWVCDGSIQCHDQSDEGACGLAPEIIAAITTATVAIGVTAVYGTCVYKSFKALRHGNSEATTCQLLITALKKPGYFRQYQQAVDHRADPIELPAMTGQRTRQFQEQVPNEQRACQSQEQSQEQKATPLERQKSLWV